MVNPSRPLPLTEPPHPGNEQVNKTPYHLRAIIAGPAPQACSHRKWLGPSRQGRSPTGETVGRGEARPVLLGQQQFSLSLWPARHQPPGTQSLHH